MLFAVVLLLTLFSASLADERVAESACETRYARLEQRLEIRHESAVVRCTWGVGLLPHKKTF